MEFVSSDERGHPAHPSKIAGEDDIRTPSDENNCRKTYLANFRVRCIHLPTVVLPDEGGPEISTLPECKPYPNGFAAYLKMRTKK